MTGGQAKKNLRLGGGHRAGSFHAKWQINVLRCSICNIENKENHRLKSFLSSEKWGLTAVKGDLIESNHVPNSHGQNGHVVLVPQGLLAVFTIKGVSLFTSQCVCTTRAVSALIVFRFFDSRPGAA